MLLSYFCVLKQIKFRTKLKAERNIKIMNKVELVKRIVEISSEEVNQKQVGAVLEALEIVVKNIVITGDEVTIPGICKVKSRIVPERTGKVMMGVNKGETWTKPEHKEAVVKIVKSLKKVFE